MVVVDELGDVVVTPPVGSVVLVVPPTFVVVVVGAVVVVVVVVADDDVPVVVVPVGGTTTTALVRMLRGTVGVTVCGSVEDRCCQPIQNPTSRNTTATAAVVTWPVVGRHDSRGIFIAADSGVPASRVMVPTPGTAIVGPGPGRCADRIRGNLPAVADVTRSLRAELT